MIAGRAWYDEPCRVVNPNLQARSRTVPLLCESVDRHVTSFSTHYLLVPDADVACSLHLANAHRIVLPASWFLPDWLRPLPRLMQRKRRQFWWSLRARPVSGWHVQQIPQDRRDHRAARPAILHPRFRHRVLPGYRPVTLRYSEPDSAPDHAATRSPRTSLAMRAGSRPAIGCWACRRRRFRPTISSATSYSGTRRPCVRWPRASRPSPASPGSRRCAGLANSPNTCCTARSCRTSRVSPPRTCPSPTRPASAIGTSRSSASVSCKSCSAAPVRTMSHSRSLRFPAPRWQRSAPRSRSMSEPTGARGPRTNSQELVALC